jgi:membrane-anchored protein YejM (alkaline phosphatase superfamily)
MPQPALAEVLREAGYATGLFHSGFLDYFEIRYLFKDKGMQRMVGARELHLAGAPLAYSSAVHEEAAVDDMIRWIRQHKGQKFFASYITEFPHHPYLSFANSKPFPQDTWLNRYKNSLHYADSAVGRLLDALRADGLLETTLIVVVGDHGETVSTYPVGHGLHVSVEELRTPFILSNRKLFTTPLYSKVMTSHIDVPPTILRLLGLTPPKEWLGRDLLAEQIPAAMHYVTMPHSRKIGVIDNDLLCVRERSGGLELFEIGDTALTKLSQNDARYALMPQYEREIVWYDAWSYWRHLKRSQLPDVGQHESQAPPAPAPPAVGNASIPRH